MKNKPSRNLAGTTLAILGSILGVGHGVQPAAIGSQLAQRGGDAAQFGPNSPGAIRTQAATQKTTQSGIALAALLESAGAGRIGGRGCPPDVWGRSQACARMRRKNYMVQLGIKCSRI